MILARRLRNDAKSNDQKAVPPPITIASRRLLFMADDMDRAENGSEPDLHGVLRERLVFMRGDLIERLAKRRH